MFKENSPKDRILTSAVELMREKGDAALVTIRDIASRAAVGTGLINYHFRTKDGLINEAVRAFIGKEIIARWNEVTPGDGLTGTALITARLRSAADFLAEHPGISRISVLYDLESPSAGDNSSQTAGALAAMIERDFPEPRRIHPMEAAWILTGALHEAFLRSAAFRAISGLDFFIKDDRDRFIESLVSGLLG